MIPKTVDTIAAPKSNFNIGSINTSLTNCQTVFGGLTIGLLFPKACNLLLWSSLLLLRPAYLKKSLL
jgi:hypothetical protein